jgi:transposase-like protein
VFIKFTDVVEENQAKPVRARRSRKQILDLLNLFDKSGVTVAAFCRQHKVNSKVFHKWKSRYKAGTKASSSTGGFSRVQIAPSSTNALFAEVNGIRIYQAVSAHFLKELLP